MNINNTTIISSLSPSFYNKRSYQTGPFPLSIKNNRDRSKQLSDSFVSFQSSSRKVDRDHRGLLAPQEVNVLLKQSDNFTYSIDTSDLSDNYKKTIVKIMEAGDFLHDIFLNQDFPEGKQLYDKLKHLAQQGSPNTKNNLRLFELVDRRSFTYVNAITDLHENKFPIWEQGTTRHPGGTVYPTDFTYTNKEIRENLKLSPGFIADDLLSGFSVIKKATEANIQKDLQKFQDFPELIPFNFQFKEKLSKITPDKEAYYATPYSVEYADKLIPASHKLREGASYIAKEDLKLADYMFSLANSLISNNYYESDIKWVDVNGKIDFTFGPIENYYDLANKNKNFFLGEIFKKDLTATKRVSQLSAQAQELENSLPIEDQYKKDLSGKSLPIGVYDVFYRTGMNKYFFHTAQILPNDPIVAQTKGRKTLLFNNMMTSFIEKGKLKQTGDLLFNPNFKKYISSDSFINFVAGHELSHALGPDYTAKDPALTVQQALDKYDKIFEELKANTLSLYTADVLGEKGFYQAEEVNKIWVTATARDLNAFQPKEGQDYAIMRLMQFNYLKSHGAIILDPETKTLSFNFDQFSKAIKSLAKEVLEIQLLGNSDNHETLQNFLNKYSEWTEDNAYIAKKLKEVKLPSYLHQKFQSAEQIAKECQSHPS